MPRIPKRRRLLTPMKKKGSSAVKAPAAIIDKEVSTPRGRLKGALLDALDTAAEDSDEYKDTSPVRSPEPRRSSSPESRSFRRSPSHQSYVLKLFDRSVDLSQFQEDSPLYPICRAWIANQPKADYRKFGKKYDVPKGRNEVELPGPEGPVVSRIPALLPEQQLVNTAEIDATLNYEPDTPLPSRPELLQAHFGRWAGVRAAWQLQAATAEARYQRTQDVLSNINVNAMCEPVATKEDKK